MLLEASLTIPPTEGNKRKLSTLLCFLKDFSKEPEECRMEWECPLSKEMVGLRVERNARGEYRMEVLASTVPSLPFVSYSLSPEDVKKLLHSLQVELSTKWPPSSQPSS